MRKKVTVLLSTSLAWIVWAGCGQAELFSRHGNNFSALPCTQRGFQSFPSLLLYRSSVSTPNRKFVSFQAGDFSISLTSIGRNKHFRIHHENGVYTIGQRKFSSLQHLVDHYQRAPIYTSQKGEKLYLIRPLPK